MAMRVPVFFMEYYAHCALTLCKHCLQTQITPIILEMPETMYVFVSALAPHW